jgi:3-methyladenine DNA glycosylase AlkD
MLASIIASPTLLTESQFDAWVSDFDSWDLCDLCCDLLARSPFVYQKIEVYSTSKEEFVKRAAFSLMCDLAFHDKVATNEQFYSFFEWIEREAWDDRNFVRKAVNWALRQIGKRNETLRLKAIETAERILCQGTKSARWIANDALRELKSEKVIANVNRKRKCRE